MTGKKVSFQPKNGSLVTLYGCGPTVWDYCHVGNARAFLTQDLIVRVFRYAGYDVKYARNYTDIDDKIIQKSIVEKITAEEVAKKYTQAVEEDMRSLAILEPTFKPRATETIPGMIRIIESLKKRELAYSKETSFGTDILFRVRKFPRYGCLSGRKLDELEAGFRIEADSSKEDSADFVLWKAAKPGEPAWPSPWGPGRPGWHIECSAMIYDLFETGLDIHMGGIDLLFPHHENEIAQSEGFTDSTLARYWIHNGLLEMGHAKMSKSLGNLVTIREFVSKYGGEVLRLMMLNHHYRSPLDFSPENIARTEALLERLYLCKSKVEELGAFDIQSSRLIEQINDAIFDDFNSAKAMGYCLAAARQAFRSGDSQAWQEWGASISFLHSVFGILEHSGRDGIEAIKMKKRQRWNLSREFCDQIESQLRERERLRAQKQFDAADAIRINLEKQNIQLMDGPDGSSWALKEILV